MKKYLTVKEFSKLSGIEHTTLRYWDDMGLFSPAKRDGDSRYRYYSPDQITAINFISVLSNLRIPLKTISVLRNKRTPESILDMLSQQKYLLEMEMERLRACHAAILARSELIEYGLRLTGGSEGCQGNGGAEAVGESGICVLRKEEKAFVMGPPNVYADGESLFTPFYHFCAWAEEWCINLSYPAGGYHENMDAFVRAPDRPERFFSLDPTGDRLRPSGDYLVGLARGCYGDFGTLPERMAAFAQTNSLAVSGPVYIVYLHDETCVKDPSEYLAHVCVAVARHNPNERNAL